MKRHEGDHGADVANHDAELSVGVVVEPTSAVAPVVSRDRLPAYLDISGGARLVIGNELMQTTFDEATTREVVALLMSGGNLLQVDAFRKFLLGYNIAADRGDESIQGQQALVSREIDSTVRNRHEMGCINYETWNAFRKASAHHRLCLDGLSFQFPDRPIDERVGWDYMMFDNCSLSGAVLHAVDAKSASFNGSDLSGASIIDMNCTWGNFVGTNLTGAKLVNCHAQGANFTLANLNGAQVVGANKFIKCNFAQASFRGTVLSAATFQDCQFQGADLSGASGTMVTMSGLDLYKIVMPNVHFTGSCFDNSMMIGANLEESILTGCSFQNTNLTGGKLKGASMVQASLVGANLTGADLADVDLQYADLTDVIGLTPEALAKTRFFGIKCNNQGLVDAALEILRGSINAERPVYHPDPRDPRRG